MAAKKSGGGTKGGKGGDDNVVDIKAAREAVKNKQEAKIAKELKPHVLLGMAILSKFLLMITKQEFMRCIDNLWYEMSENEMRNWLNVQIEIAIRKLNMKSTARLVEETRKWIIRNPGINSIPEVKWDAHGGIVVDQHCIDPYNGVITTLTPEMYAKRSIKGPYDPKAKCPMFKQTLDDMFDDKAVIGVIQEFMGLALMLDKPKQLSKALVIVGPKDSGKSIIVDTLAGLISDTIITTPIAMLEGTHGTSAFVCDDPWVLNEAFNQGKWHVSDMVKMIIEGQRIPINRKNRELMTRQYRGPALWATNHPPSFKESTKAVVERLLLVNAKKVFSESNPTGVALVMRKEKYLKKMSDFLLERERSGILNYALEGLRRILARGSYDLPKIMLDAAHEAYAEGNMAIGFMESGHVEYVKDGKISVSDFCAAFGMWWRAERGEDRGMPSNTTVMRYLVALSDPKITVGLKSGSTRYIGGLHLTDAGLGDWFTVKHTPALMNKVSGTSETKEAVNKLWKK